MSTPSNTDRYVWCDTETFGLDPHKDPIIELAFLITDNLLLPIDDFKILVWDTPFYDEKFHTCSDFVKSMHRKSGLWDEATAYGVSLRDAQTEAAHWLAGHGVSPRDPLCGSTVQFDRAMLQSWMPQVAAMFMYRNLDVSSIKEACHRQAPTIYAEMEKRTENRQLHRADEDILDTVGEYQFYRDFFFRKELA